MSFAGAVKVRRPSMAGSQAPRLRSSCGRTIQLPVARWWSEPASEEQEVLDMALPATLDVGCGPARHALALAQRGIPTIGIDSSPGVVGAARARGALVLHRDVFGPLPAEGAWGSALLLDGNVGIGGDPERLFTRVRAVLRHGGRALVEVERPGTGTHRMCVRTEPTPGAEAWFPWAQVDGGDLDRLAVAAGFVLAGTWESAGRWFGRLDAR